jgi:hypothetical protein
MGGGGEVKKTKLPYQKSEKEIQRDIVQYLKTLDLAYTVTDASVNFRLHRRKMRKSWPDITAILPGGRTWAIEVRTEKGLYKPGQKEMLAGLAGFGALVTVARCLQDAVDAYESRSTT